MADIFEAQEKERTGMKFLKVGYNKVFGYYLEVSKSNLIWYLQNTFVNKRW